MFVWMSHPTADHISSLLFTSRLIFVIKTVIFLLSSLTGTKCVIGYSPFSMNSYSLCFSTFSVHFLLVLKVCLNCFDMFITSMNIWAVFSKACNTNATLTFATEFMALFVWIIDLKNVSIGGNKWFWDVVVHTCSCDI